MDLTHVKNLIPAPKDGLSAPDYTELRYALSADISTADETTEPVISGSWSHAQPVPNNTYPYIWMRSRYYQNVGGSWVLQSTTYSRLSGTNGSSVSLKGSVIGIYESDEELPAAGRGYYALVEDDAYVRFCHFNRGLYYWYQAQEPADVGDSYVNTGDGHLYTWNGLMWKDCGIFRGDNGVSAYVHVAWALVLDQTTAGGKAYPSSFDVEKDSSKTYNFIGFLSDNTAADSLDGSLYDWSDVRGKDAVSYYITANVASIAANANGVPVNPNEQITIKQWKRVGVGAAALSTDMILRTYTVQNGVKEYFGQSNWGNTASFKSAVAEGSDSLLAELLDTQGNIVFSLGIPVIKQGIQGPAGYSNAIITLYKRSDTELASAGITATLTYTFATDVLSGNMNGWSRTIPSGNNPVYVTAVTVSSNTGTATIASDAWPTPVRMTENGVNTAPVFLYQRGSSAPEKPGSALVYTFATGLLDGSLNGWSQQIPDTDGNPCWVIQATAVNSTATDTIAASEWMGPYKYMEDGAAAVSYSILPSVGYLVADSDGNILTPYVDISMLKTVGSESEEIFLWSNDTPYRAQYKIDDGNWTNCTKWVEQSGSIEEGNLVLYIHYGVRSSSMPQGMQMLRFRLLPSTGSDVLAELPAMTVVKHGAQGSKGPALRGPQNWSDCVLGFPFMQGAEGERFYDVVIHNNYFYECKKSHAKASDKEPGVSTGWEAYWRLGDKFDIVATKVMLAEYALIKNLGVEYVQVGGTSAYQRDANGEIVILDNENNVKFRARADGVECNQGIFNNVEIQSGKVAGFNISGNGIVNTGFTNDAYVIFRNDNRAAFAGIGGNVLPVSSGLRAVARFENEDNNDYWGLGANYAMILSARNAGRNYAFWGHGNGILNGWVGGWKFKKVSVTGDRTQILNLTESNVLIVATTLTTTPGIYLPTLDAVKLLLSSGDSPFCVRMVVHSDLSSKNFKIYGRVDTQSQEQYPLLTHWNNGRQDSVEMGPGDAIEFLLVYDTEMRSNISGYTTNYTARMINRQN